MNVDENDRERLEEARGLAELVDAMAEPEPVADIKDILVDGPDTFVPLRRYRPHLRSDRPPIVFLHGGAWIAGSMDTSDFMCRRLANGFGTDVLGVDYRLAPEHPAPAGLTDACAVIQWAENETGVVALVGESAGGNLAAAATLVMRDIQAEAGGIDIAWQLLVCPVTDTYFSDRAFADDEAAGPSQEDLRWSASLYVPDPEVRRSSYVAPLRTPDLSGLPPTVVVTAGRDPLCEQGEAYAARLHRAGVEVASIRMAGVTHGFFSDPEDTVGFEFVASLVRGRFDGQNDPGAGAVSGP